ncbi:MAG: hypothetical protein H6719_08835 [Sandaracinaceae bacterium]|nr:hypothetical protein [Sandaracinaceae bacterium]
MIRAAGTRVYPRTTPTGLHLARPIRVLRDHDVIGLTIAATHHPLTLVAPAPEPPRPWSIPGVSYRVAEGASAALAERARGRVVEILRELRGVA